MSATAGGDLFLEFPLPRPLPLPPATFRPANLNAASVYLQSGGTLLIRAGSQVRSTAGNLIINTGIFTNNAGVNAINSDGGRYLVYSNNWANHTRGGITGASVYGRPYASNPPSSIPGGVVFVYRDRPTLTVTVGDLMRMYFERNPNQPTINIAGLVNGDTFDYATDGTTFATDTTPIYAPPGSYAGALQLLSLAASDVGYNLVVDPGDITVTPSPNAPAPFVFNNNGATGPTPGSPDVMPTTADIVNALVTEPDDLVAAVGIEVTPGAAEISLQAVERVSQQFTEQIADCERQLELGGDEAAYLSCTGSCP